MARTWNWCNKVFTVIGIAALLAVFIAVWDRRIMRRVVDYVETRLIGTDNA